jgi:hypothetical protein
VKVVVQAARALHSMSPIRSIVCAVLLLLSTITPVTAADYYVGHKAAPQKLPPPLLKSTTEPLVRSESAVPQYNTSVCPQGQICTICIAGCLAGKPHVLQSKSPPLVTTRANETAAEKADRERRGVSSKPGWATITCGNDGCSGQGAPRRRSSNPDYNISVNRYF